MDNDEIVKNVQDWYGAGHYWGSLKTHECIDARLIGDGELIKGSDVLNIGCYFPGDEITYGSLAKSWTAIDFSPQVIKRCRMIKIPNVTFICMDARDMIFESDTFDFVLDFSSGDQMPEEHYNEVLGEVAAVLRPGGFFIVTFANFAYFKERETFGDFGYSRIYTQQEMIDKVTSFGFRLVHSADEDKDRTGLVFIR
jgi:SAM-dependent methyltransferase